MATEKQSPLQLDERASSKSPVKNGQANPEFDHGNEAVLLRVSDTEGGSGRHLKLAKDGRVGLRPTFALSHLAN